MSVRLEGIVVRFGHTLALDGVDLEAPPGGILALLGPSGAGKTTALRVVAGLERPSAGRVVLGGVDVAGLSAGERDVAMQFEHYGLYPQRTVFENIAFPLRAPVRAKSWPEDRIAEAVRRVADLLEIAHLLERLPRQLSGGQRQRVALARALVRRPKAMLLDEPIAHLDAKLRHLLRAGLKHHLAAEGLTTIWATPDQLEAIAVGDRIALLAGGRVVAEGTPEALYLRPPSLAAARALGEPAINEIDVTVERRAERLLVAWDDQRVALAAETAHAAAGAGPSRLTLGIRPAAVTLGGAGSLAGRIEVVEPLGGSTLVTIALGGARVRAKRPGTEGWRAGETVPVGFEADGLHLFDPSTGRALA